MDLSRFSEEVASHFVADLVLTLVLGSTIILWSTLVWRRRIKLFFGVRRGKPIQIRLSNIYVRTTRANIPITPITGTSQGPALIELEYKYALRLANAIQSRPLLRIAAALLESLGGQQVDPVRCDIGLSSRYVPNRGDDMYVDFSLDHDVAGRLNRDLSSGAFVLVGSNNYNLMTYYVLVATGSQVEFTYLPDSNGTMRRAIRVHQYFNDGSSRTFFSQDEPNGRFTDHYIVQRISDWNGSTVFICAGTTLTGTVAALTQLTNWRALMRRFGNRDFLLLFELTALDPNAEPDYESVHERWMRVREPGADDSGV